MNVFLPLRATKLCEILSYVKNKYRSKLEVEDDLRIAISQIKPRIDLLCSKHRAHGSY